MQYQSDFWLKPVIILRYEFYAPTKQSRRSRLSAESVAATSLFLLHVEGPQQRGRERRKSWKACTSGTETACTCGQKECARRNERGHNRERRAFLSRVLLFPPRLSPSFSLFVGSPENRGMSSCMARVVVSVSVDLHPEPSSLRYRKRSAGSLACHSTCHVWIRTHASSDLGAGTRRADDTGNPEGLGKGRREVANGKRKPPTFSGCRVFPTRFAGADLPRRWFDSLRVARNVSLCRSTPEISPPEKHPASGTCEDPEGATATKLNSVMRQCQWKLRSFDFRLKRNELSTIVAHRQLFGWFLGISGVGYNIVWY